MPFIHLFIYSRLRPFLRSCVSSSTTRTLYLRECVCVFAHFCVLFIIADCNNYFQVLAVIEFNDQNRYRTRYKNEQQSVTSRLHDFLRFLSLSLAFCFHLSILNFKLIVSLSHASNITTSVTENAYDLRIEFCCYI